MLCRLLNGVTFLLTFQLKLNSLKLHSQVSDSNTANVALIYL